MYYVDTETCGLHGVAVLLQYARAESEIVLHDIWRRPIAETLALIEDIADKGIIGFNLAFDWFHLCKIHTMFSLFPDKGAIPEEHIDELAVLEERARFGPCLKPRHAFDLMLHARKGPFQGLMAREDIKVRKVPLALAHALARELEKRVKVDEIYFAGKKNKYAPKWGVYECKNRDGTISPDFKDVVLKFAPSGRLKTLAHYALGIEEPILFGDINIDSKFLPYDLGYAPFCTAISSLKRGWKVEVKHQTFYAWPALLQHHIDHWAHFQRARDYARDDITYTRGLYHYFKDPPVDDDDSILACMVAAVRWSGYSIDVPRLKAQRDIANKMVRRAPRSPKMVKAYIEAACNETEAIVLQASTGKVTLESIAKWTQECPNCKGTGIKEGAECIVCRGSCEIEHDAASRARECLEARKAKKEVELYDKLIFAGRFHASFIVIGTLSSRMAGSDGLNAQGINHAKAVRVCFTFADDGFDFSGGDFSSFEICIADAVYDDPVMRADLKAGIKLHNVMGALLFDKTEAEVAATDGISPPAIDMYDCGKKGNFLLIYGGDAGTFERKLPVTLEKGEQAFRMFFTRYPTFGAKRKSQMSAFCSMTQPGGIGTAVIWKDPVEYAESLFGFRRYFTLENAICKALFDLSRDVPPEWKALKLKVQRRDRVQTASGATQSALYGAAFGLQAANMRAGLNHRVQSTGAQVTKRVECAIWELQPVGVHPFIVKPANVHDEILAPTRIGYQGQVKQKVQAAIENYRSAIPLLKMEWKTGLASWAEKK